MSFYFELLEKFPQFSLSKPGDGRWRQVIRRCASVADTGVTGVCNWGVKENGVYWEECYCAQDGCNHGSNTSSSLIVILMSLLFYFSLERFM